MRKDKLARGVDLYLMDILCIEKTEIFILYIYIYIYIVIYIIECIKIFRQLDPFDMHLKTESLRMWIIN